METESSKITVEWTGGKIAGAGGAAARLGLMRRTLYSRMKKLNIERQYASTVVMGSRCSETLV
jgi:transcriptional regulator of acetoin/glycerol metabolism